MLWTFRDISFVPHDLYPNGGESAAAVRIGYGAEVCPGFQAVLINLSAEALPFFQQFERIAEVVDQSPPVREAGRARYRFYRDQGMMLTHHEIK